MPPTSVGGAVTYNSENFCEQIGGLMGCASSCKIVNCHTDVEFHAHTLDPDIFYRAANFVGGLVGEAHNACELTSCTVSGDIFDTGYDSGGLVGGFWHGGTIRDCHATGDVSVFTLPYASSSCIGGLCGGCDADLVIGCSATGNVTGGPDGSSWMGGLCGYTSLACKISQSFATGNVKGDDTLGGLVGNFGGLWASDCYATGNVEATGTDPRAGGLMGWMADIPLTNCHSTGRVTAPNADPTTPTAGGLVGMKQTPETANIANCFWDVEASGIVTSAGLGAVGKTTAEMQDLATFAPWSIADPFGYTDETWYIVPGDDYPHLAWEGVPIPPDVTVRLAIFSATEKFITGRAIHVKGPVVECSMADTVVEEGDVILLKIPGTLEPGAEIPVYVRAPGRIGVSKVIRYAGEDAENIVWLWDVSQYA